MPFSTGEARDGRRLVGADRATWVRLLVALALAGAAAAFPHVGWTSAEFTDSPSSTGVVKTAVDFDPDADTDAVPTADPTEGSSPSAEPTDD